MGDVRVGPPHLADCRYATISSVAPLPPPPSTARLPPPTTPVPTPSHAPPLPLPLHPPRVRWRVDVTLSTSDVAKVLRPNIVMRFDLTDGTSRTFEVPLARFHEMRRGVAVMLDEMDWAGDELDKANEIGARAKAQWEKLKDLSEKLGISKPQ